MNENKDNADTQSADEQAAAPAPPKSASSITVTRTFPDGTVVRMEGDEAKEWLEDNEAGASLMETHRKMLEAFSTRTDHVESLLDSIERDPFDMFTDLFNPVLPRRAFRRPSLLGDLSPWFAPVFPAPLVTSETRTEVRSDPQPAEAVEADRADERADDSDESAAPVESSPDSAEIAALRAAAADEDRTKADREAATRALRILGAD